MWRTNIDFVSQKRSCGFVYCLCHRHRNWGVWHFRAGLSPQLCWLPPGWIKWIYEGISNKSVLEICLFFDRCGESGQPVKQSRCMYLPRMWRRCLLHPCHRHSAWLCLRRSTPTSGYCQGCRSLPAQQRLKNSIKVTWQEGRENIWCSLSWL